MVNKINDILKYSKIIFELICNQGKEARFVGGCVRDYLLNKKAYDIDLATTMLSADLEKILKKNNLRYILTGIKFGTITIYPEESSDIKIEVTTLRKDIICDGRHAIVEFTEDWYEDAKRRDFTINAMNMDIHGNIYDYFNGKEDLKNGIIKFVGNPDERIIEDYLRILRFFRFLSFYGNYDHLDENSLSACRHHGKNIKYLAGERIQQEMFKIFLAKKLVNTMRIMDNIGVMQELVIYNINIFQVLDKLRNIEDHLNIEYSYYRILAVFARHNKNNIEYMMRNWKLSNKHKKYLCKVGSIFFKRNDENIKLIFFNNYEIFKDLILLNWSESKEDYEELFDQSNLWQYKPIPINGTHFINYGFHGPYIKKLLNYATKLWVESNYMLSKEALLEKTMQKNNL